MRIETREGAPVLHKLSLDEGDCGKEQPGRLLWMAQTLHLIRRFEETLLELKAKELVHGPVHTSIGQEAVAVGTAFALRAQDKVAGTHRAHHQYLAKAIAALVREGSDPRAGLSEDMHEAVRVLLSEVMGLRDGCSGGRGGSMHLYNPAVGVAGTNAIVGGGIPMATGGAWADLKNGLDWITVCFFGDGALYQGTLHESANLAALWKIPVIFFIENNQFAVATSRQEACSARELGDVAAAYGTRALQVDGMDPLAVSLAVRKIREQRGDWLPCFIDAETYRFFHHAGGTPGSAFGYRGKEEEAAWLLRDPVSAFPALLMRAGILREQEERALRRQADECMARAVAACTEKRGEMLVVKESLWPDPATLANGLRDEAALSGARFLEAADLPGTRELTYVEAIAEVTGRWLEKDRRVVVLGEEVANFGGGAYGATKGLPKRFPDRVINTPISEAGFSGLAFGAAMNGLRPIVEIMFSSFALVAADQLFNQAGQLGHIYGGKASVPLVARTRVAIGLGYGAQHSMDPAALFALFPGWRVMAPSNAFDYAGLFNWAMRSRSPTVFIEHQELYGRKFAMPDGPLDYEVQPGRAAVVRRGKDVTVVTYSITVSQAQEAARALEAEGIDAEVIDLRSLDAAGIDYATLGASLGKTGAIVFVEQAPQCSTLGPRIAAECLRRFFDSFDAPPVFVAAPSVPIPVSRRLELACIPTVQDITAAVRAAVRREDPTPRKMR
jgi:2-oxoisovalerate dehydrogenase E1 component